MSLKKFFTGEPMPDKDDPKYRERYEREVEAGRKFAHASGISWTARRLQSWGQSHRIAFLVLVFGFVITCFIINGFRLFKAYKGGIPSKAVAVERLDSALHDSHYPHEDFEN